MKIIFLGTLGEIEEICPGHKKKSGILFVKDGKKLLVDCGDSSHLETNPDYIFITHFHPDHYLGLENRSLEIYTSKICTRDLPEDLSVKLKTIDSGKLGPFKVQTFPTIHSKKVHSVALKVDNVLYTSDLIGFSNGAKKDRDKIFQGVDFVIGDGSFIKKGGMVRRDPDTGEIYGHTGIPNIVKWCEEQNVKALFITHFGEWFTKDPKKGIEKLQSLSKTLKILPARDGLEVDLSDLALEPEDVKAITPEKIAEIKTAMYLVPRHARLIYDGDKDLIVKSRKFTSHVKEEMLLIDNKFAYGYIYLKEPKKISKEDFEKLRDRHKITDKETKEWGWDLDNLYAYEFTFQKFPIPRPIRIPKGVQTFVSIDKVKFLIPKTMEDHELEFYHAFYHSCANELADLCCGAHYLIALEMLRRGLPHFYRSSCDRPIELIKDLENYDPSSVKSDRVLGDDWRILLAWYSQHYSKSGPKTPFKYSKELIIKKAVELFKEMIKRGFTFDKPENYKPGARELFEIVIKKIGKDKIPWKEELKWIPPKGWTIRDISPDYLEELPDQDLIELYRYLHRLFERWGTITEDLESANIFVGTEMWKRGIYFENRIEDDLTLATELEIVEYPTAKGFASQEIGDIITLDQVLQAFKEHPVIPVFGQPYAAYLAGRIVNEGKIPSDHDIDLIFRQKPDPRLIASIKRTLPKWLSERLHIVFDPFGPEIGYCYDENTEVLTDKGWKFFKDLTPKDKVLTLNTRKNQAEYVLPTQILAFKYSGEMIRIKNTRNFDLLITPNHRLILWDRETRENVFEKEAKEFPTHHWIRRDIPWKGIEPEFFVLPAYRNTWTVKHKQGWIIPREYYSPPKKIPIEIWLKFFGFWLSEGWTTKNGYVGIAQNPGPVAQEIQETLDKLGFKYRIDKTPYGCLQFKIKNRQLWSYLRRFGKARDKYIPRYLLMLSPRLLSILKEALFKGDGHKCQNWRFFTASKRLADDVQELILKCGKNAVIKYRKDRGIYEVYENSYTFFRTRREVYSIENYNGWIYDVYVPPNHIILVRRNGKVCWSGNSIPIYRYGFFLVSKEEMKRGWGPFRYEELSLKPGEKFKLLKQKTGWQKNEFWRFDNLWENWASKYIDRGIHVSKKYDGRAFLVWILKDGTVKLITEDQMRDRADQLPNVCEELRKVFKGHDVAMHVEAVCYDCGNKIVKSADLKEKTCPEIPREDTAFLTVGKITPEQENTIVLHAHDLMYFDEDLTQKPYCERFELLLRKVPKNLRYLNVVKHCIAHNLQQFRHCVKLMRTEKGSEGAFFRVCDATYPVKKSGENRSPLLAKIKNLKSIDVMVWDVIEKKEKKTGKGLGQYMYDCVFLIPCSEKDKFAQVYEWNGKCYAYIGRTYATAEKNKRGDIIEVLVGRIREYEKDGKIYFTWMFPKYREKRPDKKDPDTLDVVRKLAKVGPGYIEEMSDDEDIYVKLQLCPYYNDPRVCRLKLIFGRPRYEELSEISMLNFEGRDLQERVSIEELKVILENLKFPIICPLAMIYRCAYLKSYYYGKIAFDPKEMIIKPLDEVEEEE